MGTKTGDFWGLRKFILKNRNGCSIMGMNENKHSGGRKMENETLRDGSKITIEIHADWPEEDRKELQAQVDALNESLEKSYGLACKLMEMLNNGPEINLI